MNFPPVNKEAVRRCITIRLAVQSLSGLVTRVVTAGGILLAGCTAPQYADVAPRGPVTAYDHEAMARETGERHALDLSRHEHETKRFRERLRLQLSQSKTNIVRR